MAMLLNDEIEIPFTVRIKSSWQDIRNSVDEVKEIKKFNQGAHLSQGSIVTIDEYKSFKLEFIGPEDAYLLVENVQKDPAEALKLQSNEEEIIFNQRAENEFPWVPDEYLLTAVYDNKKFYSSFKIKPKNVSEVQIKKLRKMINQLIHDLVFDINSFKASGRLRENHYDLLQSELALLDLIEDRLERIIININDILKSPLQSISKEYKKTSGKFRLDRKAIRWLASNKGQALNNSVNNPNILYQKVVENTLDNKENKWFIKMVDFIMKKLKKLEKKLRKERDKQKLRCQRLKQQIRERKVRLKKLKAEWNSYVLNDEIQRTEGEMKGREEEIKHRQLTIDSITENLRRANKLLKNFDFILHSELYTKNQDFRRVKKPTKRLLKDRRYKEIYTLYKNILSHGQDEEISPQKNYTFKETSKLYEYYVLINTMNALRELGFKWEEDDWLKEQVENEAIITEIPAGTAINFKNEKYRLKVYYEDTIEVCSEDELSPQEARFFTTTTPLAPDIRVDIYDLNDRLQKSFIIEVKYRRYDSLYKDSVSAPTKVTNKLSDYEGKIEYINPPKGCVRPIRPVEKIIITYPQDPYKREIVSKKNFERFAFIQLSPNKGQEGQYGYNEFKKELQEVIEIDEK